ncbi:MAG: ABC transporter ATP-binding protein [Chloroflexi bacterium]|nr:ABC transporter ATP-binding protein [Ardenticatenaceae bacterium]MBL1130729.1 ABC transporter ATP-binding protein [Chloroflexota bacterium]NOG36823.1 ABC transporter ATP-binding protein [Chloroflexota bacterium]
MSKREFHLEDEHRYDRSGAVRWIWSHLWQYPWLPVLVVLASVVNNFAASGVQVLIGRTFDLITSDNWAVAALVGLSLAVFGVIAVQSIMGLARNWTNEFVAQRVERDARQEFYISLLGKDQTFHGRQRIGDVMARATNDVRTLNLMFSPGLMLIVDSLMGIVAPIVLITLLDPRLLLVPATFLLLFVVTVWDYSRQLNPVSLAQREQFGLMNAGLAEAIGGIEVVKGNAQEQQELEEFTENASRFKDYFVKQGIIQARYLPLLVFSVCLGLAFFHALWLWQAGTLTLGQVVTYMGLFGMLRFPTFISIFSFNLVQLGIASADRLLEMMNDETELDENEKGISRPIHGRVTFENVSFGYDGTPVIKNISFTAEPGQTVAIVGQTGSGKSTLTRLINRIFDANDGRVLVDGIDVRDWSLESLRSQISTIEQDVFLFSRSIAENIAFGCPDATMMEIETAARQAQAHDFIMSFDQGYETEVGERGATLSGGQRQRVAIARAFLTNPRILILDDSTSAIDSATEDQIQKAMRHISRQRTTFLITHRLSQIRWADQILVLSHGELVDQGAHEELLARSPAYQRIFARYD